MTSNTKDAKNTKDTLTKVQHDLSPKEIVAKLDEHIIGQSDAKKSVAIAVVNRIRRMATPEDIRPAIQPKNVMMIGPTGVGKTEIARQIANILDAPFIKTEATKYTEVGYVGKDVETIIRDLVDQTFKRLRKKQIDDLFDQYTDKAKTQIVHRLLSPSVSQETLERYLEMINNGELDEKEVEIEVDAEQSGGNSFEIPGAGAAISAFSLSDILGKGAVPKKRKKMLVKDAIKVVTEDLVNENIDEDDLKRLAVDKVEEQGIVFIDEIDKIAISNNSKSGEVSREGVQRDLLPLIEGTTVSTKYGFVSTDHILFISSGAFHSSKPSDLSAEFQGRFPIRVNLKGLEKEDLIRIMKEPKFSLLRQHEALFKTEAVNVIFEEEAIDFIAETASSMNREIENIGARRLHTILEKVLEELSFDACDMKVNATFKIDLKYVEKHLEDLKFDKNLADSVL